MDLGRAYLKSMITFHHDVCCNEHSARSSWLFSLPEKNSARIQVQKTRLNNIRSSLSSQIKTISMGLMQHPRWYQWKINLISYTGYFPKSNIIYSPWVNLSLNTLWLFPLWDDLSMYGVSSCLLYGNDDNALWFNPPVFLRWYRVMVRVWLLGGWLISSLLSCLCIPA